MREIQGLADAGIFACRCSWYLARARFPRRMPIPGVGRLKIGLRGIAALLHPANGRGAADRDAMARKVGGHAASLR